MTPTKTLRPGLAPALRLEGQTHYRELIRALREDDHAKVLQLRGCWALIAAYVREEEPDIELDPDKQAALILWLSTPSDHEPTDWKGAKGTPAFVLEERIAQLAVVEQMWLAWAAPERHLESLERALKADGYPAPTEWLEGAVYSFRSASPLEFLDEKLAEKPQFRLDVVAGYGALVDQLLLEQGRDLAGAWLGVCGGKQVTLVLPDRTPVTLTSLAGAVASGLPEHFAVNKHWKQAAERLARAVTLSLPAHRDVLPRAIVECEAGQYRLRSTR